MTQSAITRYFKKETQSMTTLTSTHYIKEEIDIDWDETDNCYGEVFDNEPQSTERRTEEEEPNQQKECNAREFLEKLPEPVLQKCKSPKKNAATIKTQSEFPEKCPKCKNGFKNKTYLYMHARYCGKERDLQCAHCPYKTKYKSSLIGHLSRTHGNEKNIHQNGHNNTRKYFRICEKCNATSEALFPVQCDICFNKLLYQCSVCAKIFKTRSLVTYHWSTRCGVKGYFNCTKCDFKSVWRWKVVQHMKRMHSSSELSQELENIEWISLNYENKIAESNTYKCPKCTKTLENPFKLSQHIQLCGGLASAKNVEMSSKKSREVRNVDSKLTLSTCSNCGKQFGHVYSLNDHIRNCKKTMEYMTKVTNYEDVKDYKIDYPSEPLISAGKRYARYIEMMVRYCGKCHEDSSVEEKNRGIGRKVSCRRCQTTLLFKCKKCLKECTKYEIMKHHLDTMCNPKKEFQCTKCSFKSYISKSIKQHYFIMHRNANIECKQCGSKFRRKNQLRIHLLRCGVEPIFQCEHCSFKSKRKLYLKKHIFRNHMKPLVIDECVVKEKSRLPLSGAKIHLEAYCLKCKNKQRLSNRFKTCTKCKTKLYFQCKTCNKNHNADDKSACNHIKSYLEEIKFD